jgi:hypothetical protein
LSIVRSSSRGRPIDVRGSNGRTKSHSASVSCPELDTAAGHVRNFGEILSGRLGATLPARIDAVEASQLPGLTDFARHLLRDLDAVTAGLT